MKTKINTKNGDVLSVLGFGCTKFPTKGLLIDETKTIDLLHDAIDKGINYFDTSYVYKLGKSESILGQALQGGYREKVKISTKLPPYMVKEIENAKQIFQNQLTKLQTDYIDYYLFHMLTDKQMFDKMVSIGVLEWMEEQKKVGNIRNIGFSFHGYKSDFELLLHAYPWDFCMIQYNYMDDENQAGKSGLKLAASLGIPVIVMEPLRGGKLVNSLPHEVIKVFKDYDKKRNPAEWGLRWIWNQPEVMLLLSGMSNEQQVEENISIADSVEENSLCKEELYIYENVKKILLEKTKIPCTNCGYCMPCPAGVNIPGCFSYYNDKYLLKDKSMRRKYIQNLGVLTQNPADASQCKGCRKCESHCPQNIAICAQLKAVSKEMNDILYKPMIGLVRMMLRINNRKKP